MGSKLIQRDERLRNHRQRLIDEYTKNGIDKEHKEIYKGTIDMITNSIYHAYNEFSGYDLLEDDIKEIKESMDKLNKDVMGRIRFYFAILGSAVMLASFLMKIL